MKKSTPMYFLHIPQMLINQLYIQLVHSMKINHEVVNNSVQEIQDIFKAMNFDNWIHEDILYGKRPFGKVEPNNATKIQKKIISERKAFL